MTSPNSPSQGNLRLLVPPAETEAERVADESELLPELVLQISAIRKMDLGRIIAEEHERRRRHVCLGGVKKFDPLARPARGRMLCHRFSEHFVERCRGDSLLSLLHDDQRGLEYL